MSDRITCPVHSVVIEGMKGDIKELAEKEAADITELKAADKAHGDTLATFEKTLNAGIQKILTWLVILFGTTAAGLIVFIVLNIRIPTP